MSTTTSAPAPFQEGSAVTERSVGSEPWGRFLIAIDERARRGREPAAEMPPEWRAGVSEDHQTRNRGVTG